MGECCLEWNRMGILLVTFVVMAIQGLVYLCQAITYIMIHNMYEKTLVGIEANTTASVVVGETPSAP